MSRTAVSTRSLPLAIVGLVMIGFTSVLVSSVTSMALEVLAETFAVSMGTVVWVTTAFVLAAGMSLPAAGWAVDRFGGFAVLLVGLVVFSGGSIGSGLAGTFEQLLVARALQGAGGGVLEPASLALIAQLAQRKRIGTVMGLMSMVIYLAPAVGPLIGAALLSELSWRSIFLFAVPPIALAAAVLALSVTRKESRSDPAPPPSRAQFDLIGLILAALGFVAILFAITQASSGALVPALASGAVSAAALGTYWSRSLRVADPLIDVRQFRDRRFSGAVAIMGLGGTVLFSLLTVIPIVAERTWELDGLARAVPLGALGLGMLFSMGTAGALSDRYGSRHIAAISSGAAGIGLAVVAVSVYLGGSWSWWIGTALLFAVGLGYGAVSSPTLAALYRVLPAEKVGSGTTAALMAVQIGAGVGATGIGAMLDAVRVQPFAVVFGVLALCMLTAAVLARAFLPTKS